MRECPLEPIALLPARAMGGGVAMLRHWAVLTKLPIALASSLTALLGFRMAGGPWGWPCLGLLGSTLLLGMGAAALNEIQERAFDARMERTRHRPLPSGAIPLKWAWVFVPVSALGGLSGLAWGFGLMPAGAGLLAMVWYNGVYTPLKRRTPWAVLPGALIGAIPPFIGWTAAGRGPWAAPILVIGLLFFLWQVPHFWALVLLHRQDYVRGGFPTPDQRLSTRGLARLTFAWILLLMASSALLPTVGLILSPGGVGLLALANLALLWVARRIVQVDKTIALRVFLAVNSFALLVGGLMLLDPCLR